MPHFVLVGGPADRTSLECADPLGRIEIEVPRPSSVNFGRWRRSHFELDRRARPDTVCAGYLRTEIRVHEADESVRSVVFYRHEDLTYGQALERLLEAY